MMRKLVVVALLLIAGAPQDPKAVDVIVDAPASFAPGSTGAIRVAVVRSMSLTETNPVEGAEIAVTLAKEKVFHGKTDARGTAAISFRVPDLPEGTHPLKIEIASAAGPAAFEQPVALRRDQKILLVTDKPIYQPGQTIHLRALALADLTLEAVKDRDLLFEIDDAKGNKVFKRSVQTSRFGVASTDFTLADEVNVGDFKIAAQLGNAKSEKTVTVKKYVLPKFKVELKTERNWYEPLALVKGTIQADYFFGKPVEGRVTVKASTFDVAFREFARVEATCDANGRAEFEFKLPDYFVGTPLEKGNALLQLEAEVTDKADHAEKVSRSLVVSPQPLRMNAIAESGKLVPGVENLIYVVVTTPDGAPVETNLSCNGKEARTSAAGFATFPMTPEAKSFRWNHQNQRILDVELRAQGATAKVEIPVEGMRESILLRLDKAIYEAGQTAKLEAFSTRKSGTVFLDIVKKGQTVLTTTTELANGRAAYPLALDPSLFGAVEVHAYVLEPNGDIVRDTKVCYVQPPQSLRIAVTTGQAEYRPGAPCTIDFRVTDQDNHGRQAALGVIIVDESVYALQDMQPGLEKIYFTLEKELSQPKIEHCVGHSLTDALQNARQDAAKMLLANVEPPLKRWNVNTLNQRHQQFAQKTQRIYWALYNYVSSEKVQATVKNEKTGVREFRRDLLEDMKAKAAKIGLSAEDLIDPWGHPVTLAGLAELSPVFRIEHWRRMFSWGVIWQAWTTLTQNGPGGAAPDLGKDFFGDPVTLERLAETDPAFSKENLAKASRSQRGYAIFHALLGYSIRAETLSRDAAGKWSFKAAVLDDLAKAQPGTAKMVAGFDLSNAGPAFAPENFAKLVEDRRRGALWQAVYRKYRKEGAGGLTALNSEGKTVLRPSLLEELVKGSYLAESQTLDASGTKFDLAVLSKEHASFRPESFFNGIGYPYNQMGGIFFQQDSTFRYPNHGGELDDQAGMVFEQGFGKGGGQFRGRGGPVPMAPAGAAKPMALDGADMLGARRMAVEKEASAGPKGGGEEFAPAARVREYFPETLFWNPQVITNEDGTFSIPVTLADSITTWRLTASANTTGGLLGSTTHSIRVFQDFFVDIDFPVALTQGDRVSVPVAVFNYLKEEQKVELKVERADWFELREGDTKTVAMKSGEVKAVYFPIRVKGIGTHTLTVHARGTRLSDAVKRSVEVVPDGKMVEVVLNDRLEANVNRVLEIPPNAIDGASKILFKAYPGVFASVMDGLDGMLRMPGG